MMRVTEDIVRLRPTTPEDHAFLYALFCEEKRQEFLLADLGEQILSGLLRSQFAIRADQFRRDFPQGKDMIVEHEGASKGRLLVSTDGLALRIVDIALSSDIRGKGVGTALLQDLQEQASSSGITEKVVLHVVESNPAYRLYERLGFRAVSQQPPYLRMEWCCGPKGIGRNLD